ncbi:MAG: hypothetical protein LBQ22_11180 [Bacteroidales bacterium]|jgi:hypothetical protein|nr:hypothetical protein [Bacteroidales bacterium]
MYWFQYLSLGCLSICILTLLWHFFRLIKLGKPKDLSEKSGNIPKAEMYSYTIAMMPTNKETAYLHIPTFTLGMLFHIGTFAGFILFVTWFFVNPEQFPYWLTICSSIILAIGAVSGISLFVKRILFKKMRELSNPDDFLSNIFTTLFQVATLAYLMLGYDFAIPYYIITSMLLLYLPVGKLRHVVYFFAARYHLGFFYGWRNSWPPQKTS